MVKYGLSTESGLPINRNMRCIEMTETAAETHTTVEINRNMRCIEI